ncbi:MAG: TIGR04076 family protein [Chloroflexi bacterium]|nr:TIGR04076 family protein [Chloroflexota bacterium]MCL5074070.1 TIGR04076 family protein [Chloroflexota bacterium]
MAEQYVVIAEVREVRGQCALGHKPGDEFEVGKYTPANLCAAAHNAIYADARVLRFGGSLPWEEYGTVLVACPDAANPVIFELRRAAKGPQE